MKISDLARKVWAHVNKNVPFPPLKSMPVPPADVRFRIGRSEKLAQSTGWSPKYDLPFIIDDTARFVSAHLRRKEVS